MTPEQMAKTPAGQQAYRIRAWAFEDPGSRAEQAKQQLDSLARQENDPRALNEISDVATMISRLLPAPARTISSQIGG